MKVGLFSPFINSGYISVKTLYACAFDEPVDAATRGTVKPILLVFHRNDVPPYAPAGEIYMNNSESKKRLQAIQPCNLHETSGNKI